MPFITTQKILGESSKEKEKLSHYPCKHGPVPL